MRKISIILILAVLFIACPADPTIPTNPIIPIEPIEPIDPVDPAFWFGEIYNELIIRVGEIDSDSYLGQTGDEMGQIANCQYVSSAIHRRWGKCLGTVPGTENRVANCEYLLKMIDKANKGRTSYGTSSYATQQIVDTIAVNTACNR
ncbi:MAG: hypothetical protein LBH20_02610, partial [Treponema sp.]|nr:hypothetical protein [Treponema sp.]